MIFLLDTASPTIRIGLAEEGGLIAEASWHADRTLAETFSDRIQAFLSFHEKTFQDLKRIRVHAGPGGFSTLRIGVVTANVLGYALRVPVEGVGGDVQSLRDLLTLPTQKTRLVIPLYDQPPSVGRGKQ